MKHIKTISLQTPAKALSGSGLFDKVQELVQNIIEFIDGLFGGGQE